MTPEEQAFAAKQKAEVSGWAVRRLAIRGYARQEARTRALARRKLQQRQQQQRCACSPAASAPRVVTACGRPASLRLPCRVLRMPTDAEPAHPFQHRPRR